MKLSPKALALTLGLLWGGAMLFLGILNALSPPYGADALIVLGSVYPGIYGDGSIKDALLGAGYGLIDGAFCGLLIAWIYNAAAAKLP